MIKTWIQKIFAQPIYVLFCLLMVTAGALSFQRWAHLEPQVTSQFFFSPKSKIVIDNNKISQRFTISDSILVALPSDDITSEAYLKKISSLTEKLKKIPGVLSVQSITHGPPSIEAAINNPLWSRLLDTQEKKSSTILCFIDMSQVNSIVAAIEAIRWREIKINGKNTIHISGVPYIIEKMRQMLSLDMRTFIAGAVLISSGVLMIMFLSLFVVIGNLLAALFAAMMTLLLQQTLGISVGVLTANLGAIVYVLTTSHVVFLTSNWRNDNHHDPNARIASTVVTTLPASFWAMLTTLLGFLSLVMMEAEPLRQLGVGGSLGTVIAFASSYLIFPIFLRFSRFKDASTEISDRFFLPLPMVLGLPIAVVILGSSLWLGYRNYSKLDTDPSLLDYFKPQQSVYTGIHHIDQMGGSNPLNFVVRHQSGEKLTNNTSFEALKALHRDIEAHPAVGSALSLAVLMEETQTHWLARWLPWGTVLNVLSNEKFGKVARGFISEDYKEALFVIRMKESVEVKDRLRVIRHLMAKPAQHQFSLQLVGGSYYMQAQLAHNIAQSIRSGISSLLALFSVIILMLSLSLTSTLFASLTLLSLVGTMVTVLGHYKIPIDIISSPALNICLGMAVDGMVHLIMDVQRQAERRGRVRRKAWVKALKRQAYPTLISALVVASGFSVFALSEFPPSQRFGLEIVFGSLVALLLTILVFPQLAHAVARHNRADKK